jgi:hypothetical protein
MKNNFLTIVNQCKQEIRKYMGNQVPLIGLPINNTFNNVNFQKNKPLNEINE